jgi:hypothetical protein
VTRFPGGGTNRAVLPSAHERHGNLFSLLRQHEMRNGADKTTTMRMVAVIWRKSGVSGDGPADAAEICSPVRLLAAS